MSEQPLYRYTLQLEDQVRLAFVAGEIDLADFYNIEKGLAGITTTEGRHITWDAVRTIAAVRESIR